MTDQNLACKSSKIQRDNFDVYFQFRHFPNYVIWKIFLWSAPPYDFCRYCIDMSHNLLPTYRLQKTVSITGLLLSLPVLLFHAPLKFILRLSAKASWFNLGLIKSLLQAGTVFLKSLPSNKLAQSIPGVNTFIRHQSGYVTSLVTRSRTFHSDQCTIDFVWRSVWCHYVHYHKSITAVYIQHSSSRYLKSWIIMFSCLFTILVEQGAF